MAIIVGVFFCSSGCSKYKIVPKKKVNKTMFIPNFSFQKKKLKAMVNRITNQPFKDFSMII